MTDDELKALLLPFEKGALSWPAGPGLFLNGRVFNGLPDNIKVQQFFRPYAQDALAEIPQGQFDMVLLVGSKAHEETLYYLGRALETLRPGGLLVCAAANDAGGRRLGKDVREAGLSINEESKYKCRVVWACKDNGQVMPGWVKAGAAQPVLDGAFISQPGIFGWNKIDTGSAVLTGQLGDATLQGKGADFGCGYGYLAAHILKHNPGIETLYCIDADYRAIEAARKNLSTYGNIVYEWADLSKQQENLPPLDFIVMNPPFHEGKKTQHTIGGAFIGNAAAALKRGGNLWMVANVHLPYETMLAEYFSTVERVTTQKGFKVFHATK